MAREPLAIEPTHWGESEIRGPVHLFRERLLLRLFGGMLAAGRVLDAGCGSGSLAFDLCRLGYQVEGVEFAAEFVEFVRSKVARFGCEQQLAVRQGSVTELDFPSASFDGLVCGEVLEHLSSAQGGDVAALKGFHRVLKPGAPCVVSVPLNPALWDHSDEWAGHVKRYTREDLAALFTAQGFAIERMCSWGFPLGRLYHRLLFAPYLKRTSGQKVEEREGRLDTRAAGNPQLVKLVAGLLRFDELFGRWPWGRGIVVCARRRSGISTND